MFTDEDVVRRILRALIDPESSERHSKDVRDSESELMLANIIYRASLAL